jgi:hypothetical protein
MCGVLLKRAAVSLLLALALIKFRVCPFGLINSDLVRRPGMGTAKFGVRLQLIERAIL